MQGFVLGDRIIQSGETHADWNCAYADIGVYRVLAVSALGHSHRARGRPRDDAFAVRSDGRWLAVAVADGVGSCEMSRYGAACAVEALCEHLMRVVIGNTATPEAANEEDAETAPPEPAVFQTTSLPDEGMYAAFGHDPTNMLYPIRELKTNQPALDDEKTPRGPFGSAEESEGAEDLPSPPLFTLPTLPQAIAAHSGYGTLTWKVAPPDAPETEAPVAMPFPKIGAIKKAFQGAANYFRFYTSETLKGDPMDYACTLIGLLLDVETGEAAVGHLGDGLAVGYRKKFTTELTSPVRPLDSSQVYTLAHDKWEECMYLRSVEPGYTSFFLMTDGVAEDASTPPPYDILNQWARDIDRETRSETETAQAAVRLLHWLATYERPGSYDDRTLVIIQQMPARREAEAAEMLSPDRQ